MTTSATPLPPPTVLDVSDLIDSPGASREVGVDVPVPEGLEVPLTDLGDELTVDGVLESLVDGVLLRGEIGLTTTARCAMCLEKIPAREVTLQVAEMFSDPKRVEDPDDLEGGYEIRADGAIDIDTLLRDAVAADLPRSPRCQPDCAGICPTCGVNLNEGECSCADEVTDDRWAKLAELNLDT